MAFIQVNLMSNALHRTVQVNVILPTDKYDSYGHYVDPDEPLKTLYLLHGIYGSSVDWVNKTRIQAFAEHNNLAVIMPSGDNMFYLNHPLSGNNYEDFIGKELVEMTRRMFHLSRKREDTFIAGLSMGGYGAIHNGLKYPETFSVIVGLSSALILEDNLSKTNDVPELIQRRDYAEFCFGNLDDALKNECNPEIQIRKLKEEGRCIPEIFLACGEDDSLLPPNVKFAAFLKNEGVNVNFEIGPGAHEWDFWDRYIRKTVYEWLPLNGSSEGIHSGNIS